MAPDNVRVRKRRTGGRDPSPVGMYGIPVETSSPSSKEIGNGKTKGRHHSQAFNHVGRKKKSKSRRGSMNPLSRWLTMKLRKTRSPLVIGLVVVVLGAVLGCLAIASVIRYVASPGDCNESHINGIPGNIYNWCYKSSSTSGITGAMNRFLGARGVRRVLSQDANTIPGTPEEMIRAINSHERLLKEVITEDQDDVCYADLARLGTMMDSHKAYHQPAIGPCHYDYPMTNKPRAGSYEDYIDFFFFRDGEDSSHWDKLKCLNECVDRVLVTEGDEDGEVMEKAREDFGEEKRPKHGGHFKDSWKRKKREKARKFTKQRRHKYRQQQEPHEVGLYELTPADTVPVDDIMLVEAVRAGMTFIVEKLMIKHGLDPLYRQIDNNPGNSRNLNAIQEAIRGGYAEIVGILTAGDNSIVIDDYGRTVEDYIQMNGSPIRPVDAKNVLGIDVREGDHRAPPELKPHRKKKSGWNETTDDNYDKERCDFDVVDGDLDPEIFYRDYFMTGRPVVLRGQVPEIESDMFAKSRWETTERFNPDQRFSVGPTAYPGLTDQESCEKDMTLTEIEHGDVCEEMPHKPMVHAFHPRRADFQELFPEFEGDVLHEKGGFRAIQRFFKIVEHYQDVVWQVFFGGDGSGATYHWHEAAFNILYVGIKEWKIAPPMYRGTTGMTAQKVAVTLDDKISLSCVQQPGDLIYIPNYWGHSTFNHGFTIGAAAIIEDYFQNGGTSYRGEPFEEEEVVEPKKEEHHDWMEKVTIAEEEKTNEEEEKVEEVAKVEEEEESPPFLFVHINKTGGTSLISMFSERCEDEYWGEEWYDENDGYHRAFHATAHAYIEKYGRKAWDNAYTFSVVRHPLARQVSNFFFLVEMGCDRSNNKCAERMIPDIDLETMTDEAKIEAFHVWIQALYKKFPPGSPDHYRFGAAGHGNEVYDTFGASQTSWMVDPDGKMVVKDIYKLEELSKDFSTLAEKIPCLKNGKVEMAKKNKTSKYPDFMLFAKDEETRKIINEVFADDFKNLGYDPV